MNIPRKNPCTNGGGGVLGQGQCHPRHEREGAATAAERVGDDDTLLWARTAEEGCWGRDNATLGTRGREQRQLRKG